MRGRRGFTLVEMAVVVVVIGIIILAVLPLLRTLRQSGAFTTTEQNLAAVMRSTAAYTLAHGRLPCPADPESFGARFGEADFVANECRRVEGLVPYATLGLAASQARDGWGHWLTFAVDTDLTLEPGNARPPTNPCSPADIAANMLGCTATSANMRRKGLCREPLSGEGDAALIIHRDGGTQRAAVLALSHGANGSRYYISSTIYNDTGANGRRRGLVPGFPACGDGTGYEDCNADGNRDFYDTEIVGDGAEPFDDILSYADRNSLVSMLGSGACETIWSGH